MIFNTHSHLNDEKFDIDREDVVKEIKNSNVTKLLVLGWDKESSVKAIELAESYDFIYAAIGFHPENLDGLNQEDFEYVMSLLNHPKVVALGEIGLDYYWDNSETTKERQKEYFIKQIEIANKVGLPICIHCRDAIGDTLEILKKNKVINSGVMHCYSGSKESMKEFVKLGLYISFGGTLTYKNSLTAKEVAKEVPLEYLLIETDDPYLPPVPFRGKRNNPAYVSYVAGELANLRNMSQKDVEEITYNNALKLFKKAL